MQRRPPEATPLEAVAERVQEDLGALAGLDERLWQQRGIWSLRVVLEDQPLVRRRASVRNEHERSDARPRRRETRDERRRAQGPQAEAEARQARGGHFFSGGSAYFWADTRASRSWRDASSCASCSTLLTASCAMTQV